MFKGNKKLASFILLISIFSGLFLNIHKANANPIFDIGRAVITAKPINDVGGQAVEPIIEVLRGNRGNCGLFSAEGIVSCVNILLVFIFGIVALVATFSANLLDLALKYLVFEMASLVNSLDAIKEAWKVFRDLSNIVFIFILLYASIRIILDSGTGGVGKIISKVIVVALFINFSLFITKAVIDSSNILALQFKNALVTKDDKVNIGETLTASFGLQTIYEPEAMKIMEPGTQAAMFIVGIIMLIILIFCFLVASVMLIIRFIVLIFLMISSPLAFVASVMPQTQKFSSKWWDKLISESFYAPAFLMLLWVAVLMIQTPGFQKLFGNRSLAKNFVAPQGSENITIATDAANFFINFILIVGFLLASIVAGKFVGSTGSSTVVGYAKNISKSMASYTKDKTIGKAASFVANREITKYAAANFGTVGRRFESGLTKISKGYRDRTESKTKLRQEQLERISKPSGKLKNTTESLKKTRDFRNLEKEEHEKTSRDLDEKKAKEYALITEINSIYKDLEARDKAQNALNAALRSGASQDTIQKIQLQLDKFDRRNISHAALAEKIREKDEAFNKVIEAEKEHNKYTASPEYKIREMKISEMSDQIDKLEGEEKVLKKGIEDRKDTYIKESDTIIPIISKIPIVSLLTTSNVNKDKLREDLNKERAKNAGKKSRKETEDKLKSLEEDLRKELDPTERQKIIDKIDGMKSRLYGGRDTS